MPPTPPPPSSPLPPPWETLEDYVAGRVDPSAAAALELRLGREPDLARRVAEVRALARALAEERFYACPEALLARIVAEHASAPLGMGRRVLALAAAVLLCVGALAAWTGSLPALDTPLAPALSTAHAGAAEARLAAAPLGDALLAQAPPVSGSTAPWIAGLATLLLASGVLLARRWGRTTSPRFAEVR